MSERNKRLAPSEQLPAHVLVGNRHIGRLNLAKPDKKSVRLTADMDLRLQAGEEGSDPTFEMIANNGGPMELGWGAPVVLDLKGMEVPSQSRPVRLQHDASRGVGHTTSITVKAKSVRATGVVSRDTEAAREVVASAKRGFPWQASVGADVLDHEFVKPGEKRRVNGRSIEGPAYVVTKSRLGEISFVDLGADDTTSIKVAAQEGGDDDGDGTGIDDNPPSPTPTPAPVQASQTQDLPVLDPQAAIQAMRDEQSRIAMCNRVLAGHPDLLDKAIADGWQQDKCELEKLRAERPASSLPGGITTTPAKSNEVLAAALDMACGLPEIDKHHTDEHVVAADKLTKGRGLGLSEFLLEAAEQNGLRERNLHSGNIKQVLEAAYGWGQPRRRVEAELSNVDVSGILSNTANKFLLLGYSNVEQVWSMISSERSVNDFKTVTSYRMTGVEQFEKVEPGGEIKHGSLGEESYTNKADTYGLMLAISRTEMINDDLGALNDIPRRLGRGAGLKLNDVFWKAFLDNATFFIAGNNNLETGAGSALSIDSLTTAKRRFLDQVDANGKPLGVMPAIMLVPTSLDVTADNLFNATELRDPGAKSLTRNPHARSFRPATSAYVGNTTFSANASQTAWYLLAEPGDVAVIEVAFLRGNRTPIIESSDLDFSRLGIAQRGYFDFGVSLQDYRGGVKSAGA